MSCVSKEPFGTQDIQPYSTMCCQPVLSNLDRSSKIDRYQVREEFFTLLQAINIKAERQTMLEARTCENATRVARSSRKGGAGSDGF